MQLLIIRHGEPDISREEFHRDPPLTELGLRQAEATAKYLREEHLDAVYISPQRRAQQTAVPLLASRSVHTTTDERLAEFDYELGSYLAPGDLQNVSRAEALARLSELQGPEFRGRVMAAFDDIISANPSRTVAVVCHGGVTNVLVGSVLDAAQPVSPHHASVTRVMASSAGVRSMHTFNEHHWVPRT